MENGGSDAQSSQVFLGEAQPWAAVGSEEDAPDLLTVGNTLVMPLIAGVVLGLTLPDKIPVISREGG